MYKPNFDLTGKVAVVTGGSRGIGFAISACLAGAGAKIVIANRKLPPAEEAVRRIQSDGGAAFAISTDVTQPESVKALIGQVIERFGAIDILVNNAGRAVAVKSIVDHTLDEWDRVMNTNVRSCFLCCRAAGPQMLKQGKGKVINIASTAGVCGMPHQISYIVSKAGVLGFTRALATEWAPYKINVNAIAPSYTETDLTRGLLQDENSVKEILARTPIGRIAKPEDIIGAALYLASPASDYVTGHTLFVDGGWTAA